MGRIEELDFESNEVAKIELSKHFGELVNILPIK